MKRTYSSAGRLTSISDRNNNTLSLTYDGSLLTTITEPTGRTLSLTYNGQRISRVTDPLGRHADFGYDASGNLTSVTDMRGKGWAYTYDDSHRLLTKVDPNSHTVLTNAHGALRRIMNQKDAMNSQTVFTWSPSNGGGVDVTDPRANRTTYYYDKQYRMTQVIDPYLQPLYYDYEDGINLTRIRDRRTGGEKRTVFTYDSHGNMLTRQNPLNNTWTYTYTSMNDLATAKDPLNNMTTYRYNQAGNLEQIENAKHEITYFGLNSYGQPDWMRDGRGKTTNYGYDTYGNLHTVTNPLGKVWTTEYDLGGRKTSTKDPLDHWNYFEYDGNNNLTKVTDGRGKFTQYEYDDANNRTKMTDRTGKITQYFYDAKNRLEKVRDALLHDTIYGYDANDNRTSLTDANNHNRAWTYDKNNRMVTESDAFQPPHTTTYEYDGAGNRTKRTDANGAITNYTYDAGYRLTTIAYPVGSVIYGYDIADRRTSMQDSTGTTQYLYDELSRYIQVTTPPTKIVGYQYDAAGNRTHISYPDGKYVDYGYDDANRLQTVTDWLGKVTNYTYDDAGRLTSTSFPTFVAQTNTYNEANQLTSIVDTKGGQIVKSFTYTLDDAGNRTAVQDLIGNEIDALDDLYRLTGAQYADGTTQSYVYDDVGNRLTKVQGQNTTNYTYDNADRLTSAGAASYTYDNNGNQTSRGADTFTWDYENRMTGAVVNGVTISYQYRGDGLKYSKTIGESSWNFWWDLNLKTPVILQDGAMTYVYGHGLISQTDASGVQTYFLPNALGSTEGLTDDAGNLTASYKYDVFGALLTGPQQSTEYRFAGQQQDDSLGYYYLRARNYDVDTGRFISKDPFHGFMRQPGSLNRYSYVQNNPANLIDPTGYCGFTDLGDCFTPKRLAGALMVATGIGMFGLSAVALVTVVPVEIATAPETGAMSLLMIPHTVGALSMPAVGGYFMIVEGVNTMLSNEAEQVGATDNQNIPSDVTYEQNAYEEG